MKSFMFCATALLLHSAVTSAFSEEPDLDEDGEDLNVGGGGYGGYTRSRRGWSMMRLGRGLQMLRLGKRTSPPSASFPHSPSSPLSSSSPQASSPEAMRELLGALLEDRRQEFRRQPPMPRYGRELDEESLEELYDLLTGDKAQPSARHASQYRHVLSRVQRSATEQGRQGSFRSDHHQHHSQEFPSSSS